MNFIKMEQFIGRISKIKIKSYQWKYDYRRIE